MANKPVKIALIGFGTVGAGVAKILLDRTDLINGKTGLALQLAHVVDTDLTSPRPVDLPAGLLHDDLDRVLADPEVSIVVELVGGTTIAADIITKLLTAGKDVVTANKALLAERGSEIYQTARQHNRCIAFEASCCGGMPVIGAIRTGLAANRITALYGIVNGTCNYILTAMTQDGAEYAVALAEAQAAGYAEADPTLDINGADSAHKLAILATLAFGTKINYHDITVSGIDAVELADINYGRELGYVIKLLAIAEQTDRGLSLRVAPAFVCQDHPLAQVAGPFNAVSIFGDAVGHTSYYGRGAGMMPTASAVVADLIDVAQGNAARFFAAAPGFGADADFAHLCPAQDVIERFYLRLDVADEPGVFAAIARVLGDSNISISACIQHESKVPDSVPVVIMTHKARQGDMDIALAAIAQLKVVRTEPVCIRVVTPPDDENFTDCCKPA